MTPKDIKAIAADISDSIPDAVISHHHLLSQDVHVFTVQAPKAWATVTFTAKELADVSNDLIALRFAKILAAKNKLNMMAAA